MYSKVTKTIELYKTAAYRFWRGYFQRFVDLRVYGYIYIYIQSSLIEKLRKLATTKRKRICVTGAKILEASKIYFV